MRQIKPDRVFKTKKPNNSMMSNSSNIEQYIQQNRSAFDTAVPSQEVWAGIEQKLDRLPTADRLEQQLMLQRALFDTAIPNDAVWQRIEQSLGGVPADSLEGFIKSNRTAFDTHTPDLRVWASIEKAIPKTSAKVVRVHWRQTLVRIAAAVVLLIAGVNIGIWHAGNSEQNGMAMSDVSQEYAELERFYQRDISAKKEKLANFASHQDEGVTEDLLQMDNMMHELREELAKVPPGNREQVVRAMIENYKAKAAILGRVLQHLEQQQPNQQQPATTNSGNHEVKSI
jgi:hypothetical protein